jgi:hypothetical protein
MVYLVAVVLPTGVTETSVLVRMASRSASVLGAAIPVNATVGSVLLLVVVEAPPQATNRVKAATEMADK